MFHKALFLFVVVMLGGCAQTDVRYNDPSIIDKDDSEIGYVYVYAHDGEVWSAYVKEVYKNGGRTNIVKNADVVNSRNAMLKLEPGIYTIVGYCTGYQWSARPATNVVVTPGSRNNVSCRATYSEAWFETKKIY